MPFTENTNSNTFAVIGAGPKGLAAAVKAAVLKELGLPAERVVVIEKHGVAAHWSGDHGYTNGEMRLGTSPEKDVVFPIETELDDPRLTRQARRRLLDFTWGSFLVQTGRFSDWVDRGRPAPCHQLWATYLKWVSDQLGPEATIVRAEVVRIGLSSDRRRWTLALREPDGRLSTLTADRLMLTGPGRLRSDFLPENAPLPAGVFDLESFWNAVKAGTFPRQGRLAIVGAGENAASILLALAKHAPELRTDVISPKGFLSTRAENFYENRFYSKPAGSGWAALELADRLEFIRRTDLGVFSVHAMSILNEEIRHRVVPGRLVSLRTGTSGPALKIEYGGVSATLEYDHVVLATGFDQAATLRALLAPAALEALERATGGPLDGATLALNIGADLAVEGMSPPLHLPMLAGVMQGPGFANLSCLGLLSDRVVLGPALARARAARPPALRPALAASSYREATP